ncbi:hypothetical protein F511_18764 [Dorcoceras hygrometricum]|uniref:Uncharacterized protein n=1 Tax=Dorcoceras hygrometricum TaxID=472368 RepID=A0A2Z7DFN0_9LAMI|nr:hypothetical protein F511_18764 [Dorcoceras hygrometricum]
MKRNVAAQQRAGTKHCSRSNQEHIAKMSKLEQELRKRKIKFTFNQNGIFTSPRTALVPPLQPVLRSYLGGRSGRECIQLRPNLVNSYSTRIQLVQGFRLKAYSYFTEYLRNECGHLMPQRDIYRSELTVYRSRSELTVDRPKSELTVDR